VSTDSDQRHQLQREALWKWRWLGLRDSTPGFKVTVLALLAVAVYVAGKTVAP